MIELEYDAEDDILYVRLGSGAVARSRAFGDSRIVDFNAGGQPIGVEFIGASAGVDLSGIPEGERIRREVEDLALEESSREFCEGLLEAMNFHGDHDQSDHGSWADGSADFEQTVAGERGKSKWFNPLKDTPAVRAAKTAAFEAAVARWGKTDDWTKGGYILKDGSQIQLRGNANGSTHDEFARAAMPQELYPEAWTEYDGKRDYDFGPGLTTLQQDTGIIRILPETDGQMQGGIGKAVVTVNLPPGGASDSQVNLLESILGQTGRLSITTPQDEWYDITQPNELRRANAIIKGERGPLTDMERARLRFHEEHDQSEHGNWASDLASGKGGVKSELKLAPVRQRAFKGEQVSIPDRFKLSKSETSKLTEQIAAAYAERAGLRNARLLGHDGKNNYPVDVVAGRTLYEVKGGQVSNSGGAQQFRITVDQNWQAEARDKARAKGPEALRRFNARAQRDALARKEKAVAAVSEQAGKQFSGGTIGVIINPVTKTADVHVFEGFHQRIGWRSEEAESGYVGTFRYR